ncbi:hypothetical protein BDR06DRAFT_1033197 [Suillus hirtellus]|nr:hypothetical protein BDR06DRAFT_1033197 [Suillus hirtellus]
MTPQEQRSNAAMAIKGCRTEEGKLVQNRREMQKIKGSLYEGVVTSPEMYVTELDHVVVMGTVKIFIALSECPSVLHNAAFTVHCTDVPELHTFITRKHDCLARFIHTVMPLANVYTSSRNDADDQDVKNGNTNQAYISWYFALAHEIAHNLVQRHNSEHEFYFPVPCEAHIAVGLIRSWTVIISRNGLEFKKMHPRKVGKSLFICGTIKVDGDSFDMMDGFNSTFRSVCRRPRLSSVMYAVSSPTNKIHLETLFDVFRYNFFYGSESMPTEPSGVRVRVRFISSSRARQSVQNGPSGDAKARPRAKQRILSLAPSQKMNVEISFQLVVSVSITKPLPDLDKESEIELQAGLTSGQFTSVDLIKAYFSRIEEVNLQVPMLRAVTNLSALQKAAILDYEKLTYVPRSALHGIPVLVKDNVATVAFEGVFDSVEWKAEGYSNA